MNLAGEKFSAKFIGWRFQNRQQVLRHPSYNYQRTLRSVVERNRASFLVISACNKFLRSPNRAEPNSSGTIKQTSITPPPQTIMELASPKRDIARRRKTMKRKLTISRTTQRSRSTPAHPPDCTPHESWRKQVAREFASCPLVTDREDTRHSKRMKAKGLRKQKH